jgi:hypothetical protein
MPAAAFVEDLSGQLESRFDVQASGVYELVWRVHDEGGSCAATPSADDGHLLRTRALEYLDAGAHWWRIATTFGDSGTYMVCTWATRLQTGETVGVGTRLVVREPRSTLSLAVPARVAAGTPFRVRVSSAAEAPRVVYVAINGAESPCAPSFSGDRSLATPVYAGGIRGTYAGTATTTLARTGIYRVCAWIQEHARDPQPERRLERVIRVIRPRTGRHDAGFDLK